MPEFSKQALPDYPAWIWIIHAHCPSGRIYWTCFDGDEPDDDLLGKLFVDGVHQWYSVDQKVGV